MDRQTFFSILDQKLTERSVKREYIDLQISQFEKYFSSMTDEEVSAQIESLDNIDALVDNICEIMSKKDQAENKKNSETEASNAEIDTGNTEVIPEREKTTAQRIVKRTSASHEPVIGTTKHTHERGEETIKNEDVLSAATIKIDKIDSSVKIQDFNINEYDDEMSSAVERINENDDGYDDEATEALNFKEIDNQTGTAGNIALFWTLLIVTLPISLTLVAMVAALFAGAFLALSAVIAALILLLICIAGAGTGLSLFGIIYGITQTFSTLPAGVYEIGIGITVGGVAMLLSILVYNFAVRLMPIIIGYLFDFMKYVCRKAKELFLYIKKECIG